ncbi:LLM class flavin-dependent oxidoreductase [Burkholderia cenocepacia]|uniref:LLM class flavin-dependent oxidoreductase n=1 Tax=Burkholderia cenocepacia TaxID=95486 RepID=UPI001C8AB3B0|nr:LLM class flavin-dependent oxidoreductase [Burkholderia cenocepacia]
MTASTSSKNPPSVFWFLPSYGDTRYLGDDASTRSASIGYLRTIAQTVDRLGFDGMLLPNGGCIDPWVVASALALETRQLKFLLAVRPGAILPAVAASMAASFDILTGGRLCINIVPGDNAALLSDGIAFDSSERYELAACWTDTFRRLLRGETVTAQNRFFALQGVRSAVLPIRPDGPEIYFGGSADAALDVAAAHTDVYLSWGEPPEQMYEKIAAIRDRAARNGRVVRFGMRVHIVVRHTETEARNAADALISRLTPAQIDAAQSEIARSDSVGRQRMTRLHGGERDRVWIRPNLWAGIGLVRGGAGTAMVGCPSSITALMNEYRSIGVDTFILSGYPHLEEAHYVAELLFPVLGIGRGREGAACERAMLY